VVVRRVNIDNNLAIFNTHRMDKYSTIEFITDIEKLWLRIEE